VDLEDDYVGQSGKKWGYAEVANFKVLSYISIRGADGNTFKI